MNLDIVLLLVWLSIIARASPAPRGGFGNGGGGTPEPHETMKEPKELRVYFKDDWFGTDVGKGFLNSSTIDGELQQLRDLHASIIPVPQFIQLHTNEGKGSKIPDRGFTWEMVDDFGKRFGGDHDYDSEKQLDVELGNVEVHAAAWGK
ncbi:hypothetical protein F5878DRAFT_623444 [Lentinula raphanica]|uniref:Uncharacterized protein n=1 Tax=Lentinula raphanica TaxID=153919 RepID=A0AA38P664_9AGAR|nr:hypothetical protein F5878DRAFT_623444 [Lentinula raphanica]